MISTCISSSAGFLNAAAWISDDDESLPPDVDDRCESDISGVADDDSDLSTMSSIGDLPLVEGDVVRSYRHQPNVTVNTALTVFTVMAVLFTGGIGVGHYLGEQRRRWRCRKTMVPPFLVDCSKNINSLNALIFMVTSCEKRRVLNLVVFVDRNIQARSGLFNLELSGTQLIIALHYKCQVLCWYLENICIVFFFITEIAK